jgi:hypothetical protein
MKILIISIILTHICLIWAKPYYLIVHGTWCRPFSWHMPGGDFYDALVQVTDQMSVSFFIWSGSNCHIDRIKAAQRLVDYIELSVSKDSELNIISHSHGSNVTFLASHIMAKDPKNKNRIQRLYALGTPINMQSYAPDMAVIQYLYNLFSFNDFVQPVFGIFTREFITHPRIANLVVLINGKGPMHSELHSPIIARWIPHLPEKLQTDCIGNFEQFNYTQPGVIHFWENKEPIYEIDKDRGKRQDRDAMILASLNNILRSNLMIEEK